ncbi:acyltransferase family protein [Tolypothrix sp. NIES-4075]|uniref:acyltransferase family protein n=1 Tax=Tolypothrix sp. NIES-4075 TaxID=2005459 RepID=UPI000B5C72E7|nr:acyltransferase [Tolypothrix sp. NIES-4075]GAX43274.1 acyltransferase family protein [Tolypothrix sp. NIES-4075]
MNVNASFKKNLSESLYLIRGVAIALVVIGHVIGYNRDYGMRQMYNSDLSFLGWLCDLINTFHMPIFFIASGVAFAVFSNKNTTFKKFVISKFEKLIIPLICWAPIYLVFQSLSKGKQFNLLDIIKATVFPYEIFWFIHALIFATLLSFICFKYFQSNLVYFSVSILLFILGFGYWNLFYAFGVFIASYLDDIRLYLEKLPLNLIFFIFIGGITTMVLTKYFIAVSNIENSRIINGPIAFLSMYLITNSREKILLPKQLEHLRLGVATSFVYLGAASMIIYLFHGYFTRGTILLIAKFLGLPNPILYFIVVSFMGIVGPIILYKLLLSKSKIFMYSIGGAK